MKTLIFLLFNIIILIANSSAEVQSTIQPIDLIHNKLDKNISWLMTNHPSKKQIIEIFGPPQIDEDKKIYYALNDFKYSLCIQFTKDSSSYINYKLPPDVHIQIKDFSHVFKADEFSTYPSTGHEKGRFLSVLLKKEKFLLIFSNNSEKKLVRIIYDQK